MPCWSRFCFWPEALGAALQEALAEEFGVEKGAFELQISLCLSEEEVEREYKAWEITRGKDGMWLYQGEPIRVFEDRMLGSCQTREEGEMDISVQRDRLGEITSVTVWRQETVSLTDGPKSGNRTGCARDISTNSAVGRLTGTAGYARIKKNLTL